MGGLEAPEATGNHSSGSCSPEGEEARGRDRCPGVPGPLYLQMLKPLQERGVSVWMLLFLPLSWDGTWGGWALAGAVGDGGVKRWPP